MTRLIGRSIYFVAYTIAMAVMLFLLISCHQASKSEEEIASYRLDSIQRVKLMDSLINIIRTEF